MFSTSNFNNVPSKHNEASHEVNDGKAPFTVPKKHNIVQKSNIAIKSICITNQ